MKTYNILLGVGAIVFVWMSTNALATSLDVSGSGASGDINTSKIFHIDLEESSGTGVFTPFVRIQAGDRKSVV